MKTKKSNLPNYLTVNETCYEKVSDNSVEVDLELHVDIIEKIDKLIEEGKYISRGDFIRSVLRQMIEDNCKK
jgi:hypothetical protein